MSTQRTHAQEPQVLIVRLFGHPASVLGLGVAAVLWLIEGAPIAAAFLVAMFYLAFTLPYIRRHYKRWVEGVYVIFFVGPLMYLLRLAFSAERLDLAAIAICGFLSIRYCFVTMINLFERRASLLGRQGIAFLVVLWLIVATTLIETDRYFDANTDLVALGILAIMLGLLFLGASIGFRRKRREVPAGRLHSGGK